MKPHDQSLKVQFAKSLFRRRLRAFGLVAPLLLFTFITFLVPIAALLFQGIHNDTYPRFMPRSAQLLVEWDGLAMPGEEIAAALVTDLAEAGASKEIGKVATHLNRQYSGARSLLVSTARDAKSFEPPYLHALVAHDAGWNDIGIWRALKLASNAYTTTYLANAVDATRQFDGTYVRNPVEERIYVKLLVKTLWISFVITGLCVALAYPLAWLLAVLPMRHSSLLLILVLLPFWTGLLVQTTSWIAILQKQGVLNDLFVFLGITSDDRRFEMVYNMMGTIVAMTHVLLPFMILPIYSVMKGIPTHYVRAAKSLGATDWTAFWTVYVPMTLPGLAAGSLLVYIIAIGYYITPALVGGESGQLLSNIIDFHMKKSLNWSLAAALGAILLGCVLILYLIYDRLIGLKNIKLG